MDESLFISSFPIREFGGMVKQICIDHIEPVFENHWIFLKLEEAKQFIKCLVQEIKELENE